MDSTTLSMVEMSSGAIQSTLLAELFHVYRLSEQAFGVDSSPTLVWMKPCAPTRLEKVMVTLSPPEENVCPEELSTRLDTVDGVLPIIAADVVMTFSPAEDLPAATVKSHST